MKKIISISLVLILALGLLAGCGSSNELKVAMSPDFAPMEFVDTSKSGQEQFVGFDVELAKYIASEMGKTLVIMPMSFEACQAAVQSGNVDMSISGFSKTDERAANYNLSDFYYAGDNETQQSIIVLKENEGKYTKAEDFSGMKIGVQSASLQLNLVNAQLPEDIEVMQFIDLGTAVEALKANTVDAVAVAHGNGEAIMSNDSSIAFSGFDFEVTDDESNNVILLKKGDDELTKQVNEILAKALAEGKYPVWYADAKALAGIETADEIVYDEEGNVSQD